MGASILQQFVVDRNFYTLLLLLRLTLFGVFLQLPHATSMIELTS
jgi:hypothetical protein